MNHSFDTDVACLIGLKKAIVLQHMQYWHIRNKANGHNFHDGHYWSYNSVKAFNEIFPYLSQKEIRAAIDSLEEEGYIISGNYNTMPFDKTKWYALTAKTLDLIDLTHLYKRANRFDEKANGDVQKGEAIPVSRTYNRTIELDKSNSSCDHVFPEENVPLNEVISTGTKGKKKGAVKSSEAYLAMVDFWLKDFHPTFTFGAMHGKSLKEIEKKITALLVAEQKPITTEVMLKTFQYMCLNLPDWFKDKDLPVINSKFNEIIQQIKNKNNGEPKQQAKFGYDAALKYRS